VLSADLAGELLSAGLLWTPRPGDRFMVPVGEMSGEIFYISEMTIEVHTRPGGRVLGFNGTTEWALDSLALNDVVWIPREEQLREQLGDRFVSLTRGLNGWSVQATVAGTERSFVDADAEVAYAHAVLATLREEIGPDEDAAADLGRPA